MGILGYRELEEEIFRAYGISPGELCGISEDAPLIRGLNAVIPVSFAETRKGTVGHAYPAFRETLRCYLSEQSDPFSESALLSLDGSLAPLLASFGYERAKFPCRYALTCLWDPESTEKPEAPGIVRITDENRNAYRNLTMRKPSEGITYAVIRDGQIACIAAENGGEKGLLREIGVECALAFRGNGFAAACVYALAERIREEGGIPVYRYYVTNRPSARTAEKAGFRIAGKFFTYTAFHS